MKRSLLDTDIFSEILKERNLQVVQTARQYRAAFGHLTISSITVSEVAKGLRRANQDARLQTFLQNLPLKEVLPFNTERARWPA